MQADITINGRGFYAITGETAEGIEWLEDNVCETEDGATFSDDTRLVQDIAEGATAEGLTVCVDGYAYLAGGLRGDRIAA